VRYIHSNRIIVQKSVMSNIKEERVRRQTLCRFQISSLVEAKSNGKAMLAKSLVNVNESLPLWCRFNKLQKDTASKQTEN